MRRIAGLQRQFRERSAPRHGQLRAAWLGRTQFAHPALHLQFGRVASPAQDDCQFRLSGEIHADANCTAHAKSDAIAKTAVGLANQQRSQRATNRGINEDEALLTTFRQRDYIPSRPSRRSRAMPSAINTQPSLRSLRPSGKSAGRSQRVRIHQLSVHHHRARIPQIANAL
jgi:hypothetical protein